MANSRDEQRFKDIEDVVGKFNWANLCSDSNITLTDTGGSPTSYQISETSIDGVTLILGHRVVLSSQTQEPENGLYYVSQLSPTVITRLATFRTYQKIHNVCVKIKDGTQEGKAVEFNTTSPFTLGSTAIEAVTISLPSSTVQVQIDELRDRISTTITNLAGGQSNKLDSIPTEKLSPGTIRTFKSPIGELKTYILMAGTKAEHLPWFVRPDDYAPTTNEKYWEYIGELSEDKTLDIEPQDGIIITESTETTIQNIGMHYKIVDLKFLTDYDPGGSPAAQPASVTSIRYNGGANMLSSPVLLNQDIIKLSDLIGVNLVEPHNYIPECKNFIVETHAGGFANRGLTIVPVKQSVYEL